MEGVGIPKKKTYYKAIEEEIFLSQEIPKRLQGTFTHLLGQGVHIVELDRAMGNYQGDHQTSEPAMHKIEITV